MLKIHAPFIRVIYIVVCLAFSGCSNTPVSSYRIPVEKKGCIPLTFNRVKADQSVKPLSENRIKKVLKETFIGDARVFIYASTEDNENLYGGYEYNQSLYDLGIIGTAIPDLSLIRIENLNLFGKNLLRIDGAIGINYPESNYYMLENGIPAPFLHAEGHVVEMDIDDNGLKELIASSAAVATTEIYKWWEDHFEFVDINDITGAAEVLPSEKEPGVFVAYYRSNLNKPRYFKYTGNTLKELDR